jgi:hypothetical protein
MRREEIELEKQGRMTPYLLRKKWALVRERTCLSQRRKELEKQEERVGKLTEEYVEALAKSLADEPPV